MSFERRSKGVVVVEFVYQYTDRTGSIISIKPEEHYFLLEKTSDDWCLVCKDERTESFYVPARCVRELPSRFPLDHADPPRPETTRVPETRRQHKTPQRAVSKTSLSGEHDMDTKAKSPIQQIPASPVPSCVSMKSDKSMNRPIMFSDGGGPSNEEGMRQQRPASPVPSCVSMKSDRSMNQPIMFSDGGGPSNEEGMRQQRPASPVPSCVSMKSDWSMNQPIMFSDGGGPSNEEGTRQQRPASPVPSCVSMKSDWSMNQPIMFSGGGGPSNKEGMRQQRPASPVPSCVSMKSDWSMNQPIMFSDGGGPSNEEGDQQEKSESHQSHHEDLSSIFTVLEETVIRFVKKELKRMKRILSSDFPEGLESQKEDQEVVDPEYQKQESSAREGALKITLHVLRNMNQKELADTLEKNERAEICRQKLKSELRKKFETVFEGIAKQGNTTLLNKIYTDLYITEGESREINKEHEVRQIETASRKSARTETAITCNNIFKPSAGRVTPIRIVLTKGVAGIGKTVSVHKFITDWAEGLANQEIQFIFPLPFRELNLLDGEEFSLMELVHHFFSETRESGISNYDKYNVLFVFDGLDECRLPLAFKKNKRWCDVTESTSVDVLLTNLIRGKLLPSALIWITTRPAAANQIPSECVDLVTEVRGFNDPQKDEYIMKRCSDEILARKIISHIKTSRILYIMCHIPVFSWITVTVLEHMLRTEKKEKMPKTLTEMYTQFLVLQTIQKKVKYHGKTETDSDWDEDSIQSIQSLGKLAFHQLEKGNLIFYEKDLKECGIDVCDASVYSGVFTQIFREDRKVFQKKVFCFVHLSFQEFLAAVFVFVSFINNDENLMSENPVPSSSNKLLALFREKPEVQFYKSAVDKALQSKNGQLDLFLRFLLGLSMESNQTDLQGLLTQTRSNTQSHEKTVKYIKKKIRENSSPERCMNLFHCLNELNDHSLVEEIQHYLSSGSLSSEKKLSSTQWSALVFVLLTSEEKMDVFDLKKYFRSEEGLLRLLPVVKDSKTALLNDCNLSERCCEALASALPSSDLTELDLSNNNLGDSGMKLLSAGLGNPLCKLETLRLSGCLVTEEGCASLASALRSNPFHLRELDLSYNHPGEKGLKLLSAGLEDPHCRLEKLNVDHGGECWIKPGLLKAWRHACELTLDPNTAHRELSLSEENRKVTRREEQPYPDHPERFEDWEQVLCREGLSGRCYWEAEWSGGVVHIAVTYKGISRRGRGADCRLGDNNKSWSLVCDDNSYSAWHNNKRTAIPAPPSSSHRVGVYLDWPAGTLSFYTVSSDTLTHLHTFHSTFTEPLYPGFCVWHDSSVSLCQVE
ncbi:protein NLRC3-like isoform X3 [Osmerus eperlanus]|uniref:protein NLRC3-like isoform X3 n=1 Tax=Osmerus eperlanus TaxID=29151 RepID=UPI002E136527